MLRRALNRELHAGRVLFCSYANIRSLAKNLSKLSLIARGRDVFFCSETHVSPRSHLSELIVPDFGRLMQLLRSEVDQFQRLAVYVRDGILTYRQRSYECGCCEVIVVKI